MEKDKKIKTSRASQTRAKTEKPKVWTPQSSQTALRPRSVLRLHFLVSVIGTLFWFFDPGPRTVYHASMSTTIITTIITQAWAYILMLGECSVGSTASTPCGTSSWNHDKAIFCMALLANGTSSVPWFRVKQN